MSFNASALRLMADKGMSAHDIAEIAAANEETRDTTADRRRAYDRERKAEKRAEAKSGGMSGGNPPDPSPNERDNLTPTREEKAEAKASTKNAEPQPWALPIGVSLQVWADLKTNRKRKRLPNTPTAWKTFLDDLQRVSIKTGIPPPELIERCTAKGWGAIYDPREERDDRRTNGMGRNQPSSDGLSSTARAAIAVFGPPGDQRSFPQ